MTIEEQVEELRPLLWLIARERIGNQTWLLDDAVQEATIAAWTRLSEGHSPGIAVHKAKQAVIDMVRGGRATGSKSHGGHVDSHTKSTSIFKDDAEGEGYVYEPEDATAEHAYDLVDLQQALWAAMDVLPDRDREILHATFWEGLTRAELAERLGVSHQAVSQRLRKSYDALRPLLAA